MKPYANQDTFGGNTHENNLVVLNSLQFLHRTKLHLAFTMMALTATNDTPLCSPIMVCLLPIPKGDEDMVSQTDLNQCPNFFNSMQHGMHHAILENHITKISSQCFAAQHHHDMAPITIATLITQTCP